MSQVWNEIYDKYGLKDPEKSKEMGAAEQCSASLEQDA